MSWKSPVWPNSLTSQITSCLFPVILFFRYTRHSTCVVPLYVLICLPVMPIPRCQRGLLLHPFHISDGMFFQPSLTELTSLPTSLPLHLPIPATWCMIHFVCLSACLFCCRCSPHSNESSMRFVFTITLKPKQCLAYSKYSINTCWITNEGNF